MNHNILLSVLLENGALSIRKAKCLLNTDIIRNIISNQSCHYEIKKGINKNSLCCSKSYMNKLCRKHYKLTNDYKGINFNKMVENLIKTQIKAYYIKDSSMILSDKILSLISSILKKIPK